MAKIRTIAEDTMILPEAVAESIVQDVTRYTGRTFDRRASYVQQLLTRAERLYLHSPSFRRKIRGTGNRGRDYLYTFMRHWYAGLLMDNEPEAVRQLRQGGAWEAFANGHELPVCTVFRA